mmetsp:Transcript_32678/g.54113  ORF Transcript_32678/g.54113 Transcript_32678/m.54113 type:complete len:95 (-) Transcript_32678:42-326(-)
MASPTRSGRPSATRSGARSRPWWLPRSSGGGGGGSGAAGGSEFAVVGGGALVLSAAWLFLEVMAVVILRNQGLYPGLPKMLLRQKQFWSNNYDN